MALQSDNAKVGKSEIEAWLITQDIEKMSGDLIAELGKQDLTKAMIKKLKAQTRKAASKN